MSTATTTIGPEDHGRRMALKDFDRAEVREGHLYELSRGIIIVSDVPRPSNGKVVAEIRKRIMAWDFGNPGKIYEVFAGNECKILLDDWQSERHPDLSVYTTPPHTDSAKVWAAWVAELVVEVVTPDSAHRDYEEKAEEYLSFGIKEYWIVDPMKKTLTVLMKRAAKWKEKVYGAGEVYECQRFKGLSIDVSGIFA